MEAANEARVYTSIESRASKSRGALRASATQQKEKGGIATWLYVEVSVLGKRRI